MERNRLMTFCVERSFGVPTGKSASAHFLHKTGNSGYAFLLLRLYNHLPNYLFDAFNHPTQHSLGKITISSMSSIISFLILGAAGYVSNVFEFHTRPIAQLSPFSDRRHCADRVAPASSITILVRDDEKAALLTPLGINVVVGKLDGLPLRRKPTWVLILLSPSVVVMLVLRH